MVCPWTYHNYINPNTYHNENFYGLARSDYRTVHSKNVEGWTAPDDKAFERNARRVKRFMAEIRSEASKIQANNVSTFVGHNKKYLRIAMHNLRC
jgi:hypothetical protein